MKALVKSAILFFLLFTNIFLNAQEATPEWEWRENFNSNQRAVKRTNYEGFAFNDSADFRNSVFKSGAGYKAVVFSSIADFTKAQFYSTVNFRSARFSAETYFKKVKFYSIVNFMSAEFSEKTYFHGAEFYSEARFRSAHFFAETYFSYGRFDSLAYFSEAQFDSSVYFSRAQFDSLAYFDEVKFGSYAYFEGVKFSKKTYFRRSIFYQNAHFNDAKFGSYIYFEKAKFAKEAYFKRAEFSGKAYFGGAKFDSLVDFTGAKFGGKINFNQTVLPQYLNFTFVSEISDVLDFTYSLQPMDTAKINIGLENVAINKMRFRYSRFRLWFPKMDNNLILLEEQREKAKKSIIKIKNLIDSLKNNGLSDTVHTGAWSDSKTLKLEKRIANLDIEILKKPYQHYEIKTGIYEDVLKMQEENSFHQSYEILDKEYQAFLYTNPGGDYGKHTGLVFNWVDKNWWDYGYDKSLIIKNIVLLYLLLSLVNAFFLKHLVNHVYMVDGIKQWTDAIQKQTIHIWLKSIPYSLFYTAVIFFSFKFDMDKLNYERNLYGWKIFNILYFIFMYIGGLVCMAYLVNYVITI